jgi:hypothetical protein
MSQLGRLFRLVRLIRFVRLLRAARLKRLRKGKDEYRLTGRERVGMQRFHIFGPKDVEKGNRIEVSISTLGKVQIDFPAYSSENQPIQFHLPVVCPHHVNKKIAANCHIIEPVEAPRDHRRRP